MEFVCGDWRINLECLWFKYMYLEISIQCSFWFQAAANFDCSNIGASFYNWTYTLYPSLDCNVSHLLLEIEISVIVWYIITSHYTACQ